MIRGIVTLDAVTLDEDLLKGYAECINDAKD